MNDIHENMAAIEIKFFTTSDWIFLGLLIFLIILFTYLYFRKKTVKKASKKEKIKTPHLKKINWEKEFTNLEKLIEKKEWKLFSHKAGNLLKIFLAKKLEKNISKKTTREILQITKKNSNANLIKEFFSKVDPVKFAGKKGGKNRAEKSLNILKEIIDAS